MNESNLVSDEEWFLLLNMTIKANTKIVKSRFGIFRVANELVFQSVIQALALTCAPRVVIRFLLWCRHALQLSESRENRSTFTGRERALTFSPGQVVVQSEC